MNPINAVLYDLDGTLVDSVPSHMAAWKHALATNGIRVTQEWLDEQHGLPEIEAARLLTTQDPEAIVQAKHAYLRANPISFRLLPGFAETKARLEANDSPSAIVTSAPRGIALHACRTIPELKSYEELLVAADDVTRGKPHPEPLLKAAKMIGEGPEHCVYVGDSYSDYLAAKAAGMAFVHFASRPEPRIPREVPIINDHRELITLIGF